MSGLQFSQVASHLDGSPRSRPHSVRPVGRHPALAQGPRSIHHGRASQERRVLDEVLQEGPRLHLGPRVERTEGDGRPVPPEGTRRQRQPHFTTSTPWSGCLGSGDTPICGSCWQPKSCGPVAGNGDPSSRFTERRERDESRGTASGSQDDGGASRSMGRAARFSRSSESRWAAVRTSRTAQACQTMPRSDLGCTRPE